MAKDRDEMDDLAKYEREHEGDGEGEDYDEEDFEDQLFCTGMINDAEGYDLKVEFFANPKAGTESKEAVKKQINDWLHESRGVINQKTGKNESVMVSRSIKKVLAVDGWIMVWYWEAF